MKESLEMAGNSPKNVYPHYCTVRYVKKREKHLLEVVDTKGAAFSSAK